MADASKATIDKLSPERIASFQKQEQAIRKAAEKLSIPAEFVAGQGRREDAVEGAAGVNDALSKNDMPTADARMQQTRDALRKLAEQLPAQEKRWSLSRPEALKLRQEQEAVARLAEAASKENQAELARRLPELAKRQSEMTDRLSKLDAPGLEERQAKAESALRLAKRDLDAGQPQDISASQQAARRELERFEQALNGKTPADEQADRLAKKQHDLVQQLKRNARQPDARRTRELQQLQSEIADAVQKLSAPEAASTKDDALALTRKAEQATTPADAATTAEAAARALQQLADQVNGRHDDNEQADRLAKKQKRVAKDAADRLAKKDLSGTTDLRKQMQQLADEARELRPGDAQSEKRAAIDALNRAQQAGSPEQLAKAAAEAATSLQRLADKIKPSEKVPTPADQKDEAIGGLPSRKQAERARRLAQQQGKLRDELARVNEQTNKEPPKNSANPLAAIIRDQEAIEKDSFEMAAGILVDPESSVASSSARHASATTQHLKNGRIDLAKIHGKKNVEELTKLAAAEAQKEWQPRAVDLRRRQKDILAQLDELDNDGQAAKAQQLERQKQLQQEIEQLAGRTQRMVEQRKQEMPNASIGKGADELNQAAEAMRNCASEINEKRTRNGSRCSGRSGQLVKTGRS